MPFIPKEHEKYDLLPLCRARGGEVFQYPGDLLDRLEEHLDPENQLIPYGFKSYGKYDQEVNRIARQFSDQPEVMELFAQFKVQIHEMNRKKQWSVLKYIGPEVDGLTPSKNYYWPSCASNPVYSGVVDDEEVTSYLYPTDADLWEILEDPTDMAYNTIYGNGKGQISKATHNHIMEQLKNAVIEE